MDKSETELQKNGKRVWTEKEIIYRVDKRIGKKYRKLRKILQDVIRGIIKYKKKGVRGNNE